jgi:hypothetical protein
MAGTSNGTDLPLIFQVQELIYRGLLPPDVYETAEPILTLREIAEGPRSQMAPQVARDVARVTQAIILRIQSMGITIQPARAPLTWLRHEGDEADDDTQRDGQRDLDLRAADAASPEDLDPLSAGYFASSAVPRERVGPETARRDVRTRVGTPSTTDPVP